MTFTTDNPLIRPYSTVYYNANPNYFRMPLEGVARTIKADCHPPAVMIPIDNEPENERDERTMLPDAAENR